MLQLQHRIDIEGTDKGMHEKAEEFLNTLLWGMDMLARPTLRNLTSSYEAWAYRNGFHQQVRRLEQAKLITREQRDIEAQVYSLTKAGRLRALGGRDPEERWARPWDATWRSVMFDLPARGNFLRHKLRRLLQLHHFGCLQRSVWVSPDPLPDMSEKFNRNDVRSIVLVEMQPTEDTTHESVVEAAWPWKRINELYARHLEVLEERPKSRLTDENHARRFQRWTALEREAWLAALKRDPLLPERLLPKGYLGKKAWTAREHLAQRVSEQVESFASSRPATK